MYVSYEYSAPVVVEHVAATAFTGGEIERAAASSGAGTSQVRVKARLPGTDGNLLRLQLIDPLTPTPATSVIPGSNNTVAVVLRRDSGGILATSNEVAAAINADRRASQLMRAAGGGTGVVAAASVSLAGANDPDISNAGARYIFSAANVGLFYFDQREPVRVHEVLVSLGGSTATTIEVVDLDASLTPISGASFTILSATATAHQTFPESLILAIRQGIRVTAAQTGRASVKVSRFRG